jgi:hypothetical protein
LGLLAARTIWNIATGSAIRHLPSYWPTPLLRILVADTELNPQVYCFLRDSTASILTLLATKFSLKGGDIPWFLESCALSNQELSKEVVYLVNQLSLSPSYREVLVQSGILDKLFAFKGEGELKELIKETTTNLLQKPTDGSKVYDSMSMIPGYGFDDSRLAALLLAASNERSEGICCP